MLSFGVLPQFQKESFFVDSHPPLSPFSMLQNAPWTLLPGYNIEKGRGGGNVKIRHEKTYTFNETGLFRGVSQLFLSMIVVSSNRPAVSARNRTVISLFVWHRRSDRDDSA